ncbi:hypothetical protein [Cyclobacterium plantarum]|uniref:hypothetical protein n=1 Tax=Cyclobacterium plantarum TaxID=2716263 RepID=UPI003F716835
MDFTLTQDSLSLTEKGVGNNIVLMDKQTLKSVQERLKIKSGAAHFDRFGETIY